MKGGLTTTTEQVEAMLDHVRVVQAAHEALAESIQDGIELGIGLTLGVGAAAFSLANPIEGLSLGDRRLDRGAAALGVAASAAILIATGVKWLKQREEREAALERICESIFALQSATQPLHDGVEGLNGLISREAWEQRFIRPFEGEGFRASDDTLEAGVEAALTELENAATIAGVASFSQRLSRQLDQACTAIEVHGADGVEGATEVLAKVVPIQQCRDTAHQTVTQRVLRSVEQWQGRVPWWAPGQIAALNWLSAADGAVLRRAKRVVRSRIRSQVLDDCSNRSFGEYALASDLIPSGFAFRGPLYRRKCFRASLKAQT